MATPAPGSLEAKIATAAETPYMFPVDIKWTDKDCA